MAMVKVLLVDDDVELVAMLKTFLERDGFEAAFGKPNRRFLVRRGVWAPR